MIRLLLLFCLAACACAQLRASPIEREQLHLDAAGLSDAPMRLRVYLPPDYAKTQARYDVLYVHDGQDMEAVGLQDTLQRLYAQFAIARIIVVAIDMPPDRMAGYGLFDRRTGQAITAPTKYGVVGANAHTYAQWLARTVVPAIDARYRTVPHAEGRAILGWSLGALSAFGIGWQHPELFGRVGAFSPSFWLSMDRTDAASVQRTRIAHRMVDDSATLRLRPRVFFGVGTHEETDDRDGDGSIDVLDDTRDLIDGWVSADGTRQRGLRVPGQVVGSDEGVALFLLEGGQHDQPSWARMLPVFLQWAYARRPGVSPWP